MKKFREADFQWQKLLELPEFQDAVMNWAKAEMELAANNAASATEMLQIARQQGIYLAFRSLLERPAFVKRKADEEEHRRANAIKRISDD